MVVVAAAEEGIFVAYHALLEPGDHVVVETPCYESALQVARSAGAEVTEWRRSAADGWAHDLDALERALRPDTRLVYVNTPHNPTGTLMPREVLDRVVELCAERGAWLFCRRGLPRARARPGRPSAGGLRPLRARALPRLDVEDVRPARPPARLARLAATAIALASHRRPQALHDDLLERPERAPQRARAPAPRRARRAQPRDRAREPPLARRVPRRGMRSRSRGRVRRRARSASSAAARGRGHDRLLRAARRRHRGAAAPRRRSTTSRRTCGSGSAAPRCRRRSASSSRGSTHVLNARRLVLRN